MTYREIFSQLPEGVREKAISNTSPDLIDEERDMSLRLALMCGFSWGKSPEGEEYWAKQFFAAGR
jgi:hypothetical protein